MKPPWRKAVVERKSGCGPSLFGEAFGELLVAVMAKGGSFRFKACGRSMHPFIQDGDVITLSALTSMRPLRAGDVIAMLHPDTGKIIVHRIIRKTAFQLQTKGDNIRTPDRMSSLDAALGRVIQVRRGERIVSMGTGPKDMLVALSSRLGLLPSRLSSLFNQTPQTP